jgi:hypothetical protein
MAIRLDPFQTIVNVNWSDDEEPEYIAFELRATSSHLGNDGPEYAGDPPIGTLQVVGVGFPGWFGHPGFYEIAWGESPGRWPGRRYVYTEGEWQIAGAELEVSNLPSYSGSVGLDENAYFGNLLSADPHGWDLGSGGGGLPPLPVVGGTVTWTGDATPEHYIASTGIYGSGPEFVRDKVLFPSVFWMAQGTSPSRTEHQRQAVTADVVAHFEGFGFRPLASGKRSGSPALDEVWIICDRSPADDIE